LIAMVTTTVRMARIATMVNHRRTEFLRLGSV
jgi:hypothetical protein